MKRNDRLGVLLRFYDGEIYEATYLDEESILDNILERNGRPVKSEATRNRCYCDGDDVEFYCPFYNMYWKGKACREHGVITDGLEPMSFIPGTFKVAYETLEKRPEWVVEYFN